jgi:hypothetical protein
VVISRDLATCRAVLRGDPVLARHLDPLVLRRTLRGGPQPPAAEFIEVDPRMLDAAAEASALHPKPSKR